MSATLLLDRTLWDLCLDAKGNIAVATEPYAIAQDVASAVRLFRGELWYDTAPGVPYFEQILGRAPPLGVTKAAIVAAALTVPLVASVKVFISAAKGREIIGQIQVTDTGGTTSVLAGSLSSPTPA
jgi:hypothetical protein